MTKTNSLTEGSITKSIILFAVPILLSNLFQQLYNSVDSAVVGRFAGAAALAAVGSTGSIINLLIGFFLGLATGTSVLYAMRYGAEDHSGLKKLIDSAMIISVIVSVFIAAVGIGFCRPLLVWMDAPEDVLPLGMTYLRIFFSGTIVTMIYNVGAAMIRAEGDSTRPLIYLIIGGVSNFFLDLLLVAVFDMGVAGAAIATVAAQAVSAVLVVLRLMHLDPRYRLQPLRMHFDRAVARDIIRVSLPCGLQGSMFSISNLLVQAKINTFGTMAIAGITAYTKLDGFIYMPISALSFAVSTYVGQNIGAGKYDRIRKGIIACLILCVGTAVFMGLVIICTCRPLLSLFTQDEEAMGYALGMMRVLAPTAWLLSANDILGGAVRGAGQPMKVTLISALTICVFRVLWLLFTLHFWRDIRLVYVCYPISWILCGIAIAVFYFKRSAVHKAAKYQIAPQI